MALYRFLFAPVLLAIAALVAPAPSAPSAPPPRIEQRAEGPASSAPRVQPTALERAGTARPIRAR